MNLKYFEYQTFADFMSDLAGLSTKAQDQWVRRRRSISIPLDINGDYYAFIDRSNYPQYDDDLDEILDKYYFTMRK